MAVISTNIITEVANMGAGGTACAQALNTINDTFTALGVGSSSDTDAEFASVSASGNIQGTGSTSIVGVGDFANATAFFNRDGNEYQLVLSADATTRYQLLVTTTSITEAITSATGEYTKTLTANRADAYTIWDGTDALLTFVTTTGALAVVPVAGIGAAGGFTASPRLCHTGGVPAQVSTEGTNLDIVVTELYVAELFIPCNMTITGAAVLWGANTNGNAKICLFDSAGTRVAISASTDVSSFTGDSYGTRIAFTAAYAAKGPATYYLGVICDDNTNDINTHILGNFGAGKIESLVYGTEAGYATITPPTTFTTGLGPIATLY